MNTLSPEEKAKELVQTFRIFVGVSETEDGGTVNNYLIGKNVAKRCAIICVDEILGTITNEHYEYWNKVKEAINNL